jgi:hypothetical protein
MSATGPAVYGGDDDASRREREVMERVAVTLPGLPAR